MTLRFYEIASCFNDDERLMAYAIQEVTQMEAHKVYKDLLRGHFTKYVTILEDFCDNIKQRDFIEWKKDTLYRIETSRDKLFVIEDMEHYEG